MELKAEWVWSGMGGLENSCRIHSMELKVALSQALDKAPNPLNRIHSMELKAPPGLT